MAGLFLVCEGIDGCGKGTAMGVMRSWAVEQGLTIFEMELFCKKHGRLPTIDEIDCDVIISQEPTCGDIGRCIRRILTRDESYSAHTLAHAFALDREVYYREIIIPARRAGKWIFQERSVMSTLVYQGAMDTSMTKYALGLTGNTLALRNAPDAIYLISCEIETAMQRIVQRSQETHLSVSRFENKEFLQHAHDRFQSEWLHDLLKVYEVELIPVQNSGTKEAFERQMLHHITRLNLEGSKQKI